MATLQHGNNNNNVYALAAFDQGAQLKPHKLGRPEPGPHDVAIDIHFCGMCHSDCHACNGDWSIDAYPISPGHEIAGIVRQVGAQVTKFNIGDRVGVGCMVSSCRECDLCQQGLEQHCPQMIQTYGSTFPEGHGETFQGAVGYHTNGGYTSAITVNEHFVFSIPASMKMEYAGVLLCAGITTFSPLNRHILQKGGGAGKSVGVVGFGGLGQMAVQLAKAMGVDRVVVFSRNDSKQADAEALGAELLVHSDETALKNAARSLDVILDTVSAPHAVNSLMSTLKVGGNYVLLGAVSKPMQVGAFPLLFNRHALEGSLIGGVPETQEMLDFCAAHNVVPKYQVIHAKDANTHFHAMIDGAAGARRSVIDMSTIAEFCQG